MGIFYSPPPPVVRSAVTPPEPHAPIGTQGDQPPRYTSALMLVAVLASWPADLEPRLVKPNNQQQKIAPLTLAYGDQPTASHLQATTSWPPTVAAWTQTWDAQSAPRSTAWNVVLLPSVIPRTPIPSLIWNAWADLPSPPPRPIAIAPLTLSYGSQPIPRSSIAVVGLAQILGTWTQAWDSQTAPKGAAWTVPAIQILPPHVSLPSAIWTAWETAFVGPSRVITIAPLTFTYGNQPPVQPPLSRTNAGIIVAAWPADLEPRLGRPNAERTRIAPLTFVYGSSPTPRGPLSSAQWRLITGTWEPPFISPPSLRVFTIGAAAGQLVQLAPAEFLVVAAQDRWFTVTADGRFVIVPAGQRFAVDEQGRFIVVDEQDREFED